VFFVVFLSIKYIENTAMLFLILILKNIPYIFMALIENRRSHNQAFHNRLFRYFEKTDIPAAKKGYPFSGKGLILFTKRVNPFYGKG
jgi:hypothetical protein